MIVYAFYGCGKTTLSQKNPSFFDLDFADFYCGLLDSGSDSDIHDIEESYANKARELEEDYPVVLVNRFIPGVAEAVVMPGSYRNCAERISKRGQGNFVPSQLEYYGILSLLQETGADVILLSDEEYLGDMSEQLLEMSQCSPSAERFEEIEDLL